MDVITPEKYLVAKMPDIVYLHYHYSDGCIHMPTVLATTEYVVIAYFKDIEGSEEMYNQMKEKGLIMHETDDAESAMILQAEMYSEAHAINQAVVDAN